MKKNTYNLRDYIRKWDPMQFIADGSPDDEYDLEADEISSRYKEDMSNEELGILVYTVFTTYMEIDPKGFKDECLLRAPYFRQELMNSKKELSSKLKLGVRIVG